MPEAQADPNAFLRQHEGKWLLVPVEDDIEDAGGNCIVVAHGDLIEFVSNRTYGQREITVESDGAYVLSEPFPDDANNFCFRAQDYESTMPSIPELIATSKDNDPHEWTPPYIAGIEAWFWGETTTFRVVIEAGAARLDRLSEPPFVAPYTNWRGETEIRRLRPIGVKFMATEWHREPQWILEAFDYDRQEMRGFALKDFGQPAPTRFKLQWECLKDDYVHVAAAPLFGSIRVEHGGRRWAVYWSVPGYCNLLLPAFFPTAEDAMKAADDQVARILFPEASNG